MAITGSVAAGGAIAATTAAEGGAVAGGVAAGGATGAATGGAAGGATGAATGGATGGATASGGSTIAKQGAQMVAGQAIQQVQKSGSSPENDEVKRQAMKGHTTLNADH